VTLTLKKETGMLGSCLYISSKKLTLLLTLLTLIFTLTFFGWES